MCSGVGSRVLLDWVSPFGHPRITARLPTPRGLSQAPTSFIGSWYQDIHRLPLVACHNNKKQNYATKRCSRPLYSSQNTGRNTSPHPPLPGRRTPCRETTHPQDTQHQPFGESRPQPPTTPTNVDVTVTQKKQSRTPRTPMVLSARARFLRTQQRASMIHSATSAFHAHK